MKQTILTIVGRASKEKTDFLIPKGLTKQQLAGVKQHNKYIETLIKSCREGIDGTWDKSDDGFEDMITMLEWLLLETSTGSAFRINDKDTNSGGTHLQGYLHVPYSALVERLGKNMPGDGDKTKAEWTIEGEIEVPLIGMKTVVATLYDWKEYRSIKNVTEWHIGGHDKHALLLVKQLFPGTNITE